MTTPVKKVEVKKPEVKKPEVKKDMTEIIWEKSCGCRVKTNVTDASIKAAMDLGWEQVKDKE